MNTASSCNSKISSPRTKQNRKTPGGGTSAFPAPPG